VESDLLKPTRAASHDLACVIVGHCTIKESAEDGADNGVMNVAAIHGVKIGIVDSRRITDLRVGIGAHDLAP
jgi:hypothetical protein